MKAYTDIEQSKKLAEILPIESADGFYEAQINPITGKWEDLLFIGNEWASPEVVIPAWSLAVLLDILPNEIKRKDFVSKDTIGNNINKYQVHIRKYTFVKGVTMYQVAYGNNFTLSGKWTDMVNSKESENLIECIIDMLVWIKKNNFINYEEGLNYED